MILKRLLISGLVLIFTPALFAQELNSGDTSWILTSTALVLFMTLPGLALFYGGLVRSKNVLSVLMQCFAIACLISVCWVVYGYSLAFKGDGQYIGDLSALFLSGIERDSMAGSIPESLFVMFQMTFAIRVVKAIVKNLFILSPYLKLIFISTALSNAIFMPKGFIWGLFI